MPVIDDDRHRLVTLVDLVDQRRQHVLFGVLAMLFEDITEIAAMAGSARRIASTRLARNHTRLLSLSSRVSHATVTPSRTSSSAHCAASVVFPYPAGA